MSQAISELLELDRDQWRKDARCATTPFPEVFFEEAMEHIARKICLQCPVRAECLKFALRNREPCGVWGGFTTREREAILRSRKALQ